MMPTTLHRAWCTDHHDDFHDAGLCSTRLTYRDDAGDTVTVTASVGRPDERRVLVDADVSDMSAREARELGALLLRAADLTDPDPDLEAIFTAWPKLPADARRIIALRAAEGAAADAADLADD